MYLSGILAKYLPKLIAECKAYKQKVAELFTPKDSHQISLNHLYKNIIVNPKALFNLVESNFLLQKKSQHLGSYYELKTEVLNFIHFLISDFPLNAKLLYDDPFLVIERNRRINFVTYLIGDVKQAFRWQLNSTPEQKQIFRNYHETSVAIFYSFCEICSLKTSQLKLIANSLTDFYYQEQLYTNLINHCFKLLSTGLQQRVIEPFISFTDDKKGEAIKVHIKQKKWHFSKGFTAILWINTQKCTEFQLLRLKSADQQSLVVKVEGGRLVITTSSTESKHEEEYVDISPLQDKQIAMIGVQMKPSGGLFNSKDFQVNIRINDKPYQNVSAKVPKFEYSELLFELSFLNSFIGKLYGIIISSIPEFDNWDEVASVSNHGPCTQQLVKELLDKNILDSEQILAIFNPERYFQGILVNYTNEDHYASCLGRTFDINHHSYKQKLIDIYLPFLYFVSLVKQKGEESYKLFDSIFKYVVEIIVKENYEVQSVMFLLYFLEINEYKISQETWDILYNHYSNNDNFYLNFVVQFIEIQSLVRNTISVDETMEPYSNPVDKLIFMFHLETLWKEKWNQLQGFQGWWSPHFFQPQNDKPFNSKDFVYSSKRQGRVQWSVLNLVTKDYCKSFLEPIFILPKYAEMNRYQRQYSKKECFSSSFQLNLNKKIKPEKLICKKISNSKFDKFKSKVFGKKQHKLEVPKKKGQQVQIKQFTSECVFIDILQVVEGSISIHSQGFVVFQSAHKNKDFDHMCAKAFKNQIFYYFNIPFEDIKQIYKKRFNASNNAVYIKTQDGRQMMFHFHLKNIDAFLNILQNFVKVKKDAFSNYVNSEQPIQWIDKFMSNYEYLQWLNEIAGRNYNDITQYPVLPWVFVGQHLQSDEQIDKTQYRDLTKNIGSHGDQQRINKFLQKYHNNNQEELFSEYHFGTHYSSSAIIFNFLIRIRPYSIGALALQSGKFDCADRIFHSYCGAWNNATTSTTDIRQLIPEIYTLPEMFINKNNYSFGLTQDKLEVDNAFLPNWANGNPFYFVSELRKQLQKRYVSENINHWIDLIYGYKQRGKDAIQHMNIFYPLTYQNCIDLDQVTERAEKISFQTQIAHFGQNPSQIIGSNPHPTRKAIKAQWEDKLVADGSQLQVHTCFLDQSQEKESLILFDSVFEGKNAVLGVKFINNDSFFVMRRNEYYVFQIMDKRTDFISKELFVELQAEEQKASLNLKQLSSFLPIASINQEIVIVGGYHSGVCNILFLKEPKYNRNFQFHNNTVTALSYDPSFQTLFVGDVQGYLKIYRVSHFPKHVEFEFVNSIKAHDSKINDISINTNANTVCTCSEDGFANIYNLYSHAIIRTFRHPTNLPIHFAHISTNPLYSIVFYSKQNSTVYVYSINGQYLDSIIEKTGFIYNMSILKATDSTECLVYLNSQKEMFIWELPFLRLKRKIKLRKDENKISCFEACNNGKTIVTGTADGSLQIIANPESY